MARRRRGLGSPKAVHHDRAEKAVKDIEFYANKTVEHVQAGDCSRADSVRIHMHQAIGKYDAHADSMRTTKRPIWYPQRSVMDANGLFNDRCTRVKANYDGLEGKKRRR